MELEKRLRIADCLEKHKHITIGKTTFSVSDGLIISDNAKIKPMTWDTFTHLFLLNVNKEDVDVNFHTSSVDDESKNIDMIEAER